MLYLSATAFAFGIWLESWLRLGIYFGFFVLVVGILCALLIKNENGFVYRLILFITLALVIGLCRMSWSETKIDRSLAESVGQQITLVGEVTREADKRDSSTRYIVRPEKSASQILLTANNSLQIEYHDIIRFTGRLDLPKNFTNENGENFDYVSFLAKDQIHFTIWQPKIEIVSQGEGSLVRTLFELKNAFVDKISEIVPEPNSSLLAGLIFGVKQSLGADLLEKFRTVGLIHIVVLSGYNLGVVAYAVHLCVSYFGKRNLGFLVSAVFLTLFAIMVGLGATVIRASIMALLAIMAKFLGRPASALRWLFIAGVFMLLWNPLYLLGDPSFQLSFMATLGLILFSPIVYTFISRRFPFIPEKFALREIVSSTLAVQIFVLPLLVRMSGEVSIISFIANPLLLPIVPVAMAFGAMTGLVGIIPMVGKFISWPFGALAFLTSEIIIRAVEYLSVLPFAVVQIGELPFWIMTGWYALCAYAYYKFQNVAVL